MYHLTQTALLQFKRIHRHCRVPTSTKDEKNQVVFLGKWVANQRSELKHLVGNMNASHDDKYMIQQLNSIGFEWSIHGKPKKTDQPVSNGLRLPTHQPSKNGLRLPKYKIS